jgi:hypothetical protein
MEYYTAIRKEALMGATVQMWGRGNRKSPYFPFSSTGNLQLLKKTKQKTKPVFGF